MSDIVSILKHRSSFDVRPIQQDGDPFMAVASLIVDWLVQKEDSYGGSPIAEDLGVDAPFPRAWDYRMPEDYYGGDYDLDRWPALCCASARGLDGEVDQWVVEYDEPDTSHDDRRWHSTICLQRVGGGEGEEEPSSACRVSVQSVCRPLGEGAAPLPETIATPALVRSIIDLPWYKSTIGPTQLQTVPNKLSAQTFASFAEALVDPQRRIPLVLFSTGSDGKVPEQAKQLARRAMGNANVYIADWSDEQIASQVETLFARGTAAGEYACPRNSCRMYMPGVDLTDHNASRSHQSWSRQEMAQLLPSKFAERLARRFIPSQPVKTVADLRRELGEPDMPAPSRGAASDGFDDGADPYADPYGDPYLDNPYNDPYDAPYEDRFGFDGRGDGRYGDDFDDGYGDRYEREGRPGRGRGRDWDDRRGFGGGRDPRGYDGYDREDGWHR